MRRLTWTIRAARQRGRFIADECVRLEMQHSFEAREIARSWRNTLPSAREDEARPAAGLAQRLRCSMAAAASL
jgi:hypothetical protein